MTKLEDGHVVRRKGSKSVQGEGNVRFVNRKADRLFIDDPEYMAQGDVVRVLWADGRRDTDERADSLQVRVFKGARMVWVDAC